MLKINFKKIKKYYFKLKYLKKQLNIYFHFLKTEELTLKSPYYMPPWAGRCM